MSSVSRDNRDLTERVADITAGYSRFQTTLRGAVAEVLNDLGNGLASMLTMNQKIETIGQSYTKAVRMEILLALGEIAASALETSKADDDATIGVKALSIADALHRGFAAEIESVIERAVARDVRTALDFVRTQLAAGRFVATSYQLTHDLEFKFTGKQTLDTTEFVTREVNWAFRSQYNAMMVSTLLARDIDEAVVDGGSKHGEVVDLMNFDSIQGKYFHHNSKSLLQPLD